MTPAIFAPGVISGPAREDSASFTPDGNTVVFDLANWHANNLAIMISQRVNGLWSAPQIAPFSGQWEDHDPAMAPDGSYLVYTSNRPAVADGQALADVSPKTGKVTPGGGAHLWRVDRTANGWGTPTPLPDVVNFGTRMYAPSVAADGTVYFQAPDPQHGYAQHLFRALYRQGRYLAPTLLSLDNPAGYEHDAAIAPDQSFIVYDGQYSSDPQANQRLYIAFREGDRWSQLIDMGDALNSYTPWSAHLGPDGRTLYFAGTHSAKVSYPRTREHAQRDIARMQAWNNDARTSGVCRWRRGWMHSTPNVSRPTAPTDDACPGSPAFSTSIIDTRQAITSPAVSDTGAAT